MTGNGDSIGIKSRSRDVTRTTTAAKVAGLQKNYYSPEATDSRLFTLVYSSIDYLIVFTFVQFLY